MATEKVAQGTRVSETREEQPVSDEIHRAAERAGVEVKKPKVTLTVELEALRDLFVAGNHSRIGDPPSEDEALTFALNVAEHAAMELHTLNLAIAGDSDQVFDEELSLHAWRISKQVEAGIEIAHALKRALPSERGGS